jgi:hypothetical protein
MPQSSLIVETTPYLISLLYNPVTIVDDVNDQAEIISLSLIVNVCSGNLPKYLVSIIEHGRSAKIL